MSTLNETHAPQLRSWVASANQDGGDFPLQNLPFGVFRRADSAEPFRAGVAIGDQILDLTAAHAAGVFSGAAEAAAQACCAPTLNAFMALAETKIDIIDRDAAVRRDAVRIVLTYGSQAQ